MEALETPRGVPTKHRPRSTSLHLALLTTVAAACLSASTIRAFAAGDGGDGGGGGSGGTNSTIAGGDGGSGAVGGTGGGGGGGGAGLTGGRGGDGSSTGASAAGGTGGAVPGASGLAGANGSDSTSGGGGGGGGGAHGVVGPSLPVFAAQGGNGGAGGDGGGGVNCSSATCGGGGGGAGGYGAIVTAPVSGTLGVAVTGGDGGAAGAGNRGAAGGGRGGIGLDFTTGASGSNVTIGANVAGGNGGAGGSGAGGAGGIGISGSNLTVTNAATIAGGSGGAGTTSNGAGGTGISGSNLTLINTGSGTITGAFGGDGVTRANAVTFTGGSNIFELQAGATTNGNVVGTGNDTFRLGGTTNSTFDLSQIGSGAQYRGFSTLMKTGTSVWTVDNSATYTGATIIETGTLALGSFGDLSSSSRVVANGTLDISQTAFSFALVNTLSGTGTVALGSHGLVVTNGSTTFGGSIQDGGLGGGTMGGLEIAGGTLTLSGTNTFTNTTQIDTGATLALKGIGSIATSGYVALSGTGSFDISQTRHGASIAGLFDPFGNSTVFLGGKVLTITGNVGPYKGVIGDGGIGGGRGGALSIAANGVMTLGGVNTYTGATTIAALGELDLTGPGSVASSHGVTADGVFDMSQANADVRLKSLSGASSGQVNLGANTLILSKASGRYAGTLGAPGDTGGLTLTGGTQILSGTASYTGGTTINGGTLEVDGAVTASNIIVNAGGTLSGTGKLGDPTINAGGTLAPGSVAAPFGTLTIAGPLTFQPGSFLAVNVAGGGRNSAVNVISFGGALGTVSINGGTVEIKSGNGTYTAGRQTILTAAAGLTGRFAGVTSNLAFLRPTLTYGVNSVSLDLSRLDYRIAALTANQLAVAGGLTNAGNANGGSGSVLTALNQLTLPEARIAFDALSGEGLAAAQNVGLRSSALFTSTIADQTAFYGTGGNSVTLPGPQPGFSALAPNSADRAPLHELADLPSSRPAPSPLPSALPQGTWRAWANGFGSADTFHGNALPIGSATQTDTIYGGALGVDYRLTSNDRIGLAVGGSDGAFQVPGRATSGSTTGGHVALYNIAEFDAFYGASSTAFSLFQNRTTRVASGFGGLAGETERGAFDSQAFRSRLEFGRHLGGFGGTITPFVALEIADLRATGFRETSVSGPGNFLLDVAGQSQASVPGAVGARFQSVMPLGGLLFSPTLQLAYLHEFAPQRTTLATIAALPGSTFLVDGAHPAANAAAVKAGGEVAFTPASVLFANFDGEFAHVSQSYAGKGGFRLLW